MKFFLSFVFFAMAMSSTSKAVSNYSMPTSNQKLALSTSGNEAHNFMADVSIKQESYVNNQKSQIRLAPSFKALKMKSESKNYRYKYEVKSLMMIVTANPKSTGLYRYIGAAKFWPNRSNYKKIFIVCKTSNNLMEKFPTPILKINNGVPSASCASGTSESTDN